MLKPLTSFNEAYEVAVRATADEVWTQIDKDLNNARGGLLPDAKYSHQQEKWRVSKGAVMALQAKVALFNERWQEVITLVGELEGSGGVL